MKTTLTAGNDGKSFATDAVVTKDGDNVNAVLSPQAVNDAGLGSDRTSLYARRQLTYLDPQVDEELFQELKTTSILPVDTAGGFNQYFTHQVREKWGEADILECCDHAPLVGMSQCEVTSRAINIGSAAKWCWSDVEYARQANLALDRELLMIADRAIFEKLEDLIWKGHSQLGVMGIINNKTIPSINLGDMTTLHPVDVMNRILIAIAQVIGRNNGVGRAPDTLLLPPSIYALWSSSMLGMNYDRSLLSVIQEQSPFIQRIDWVHALETAGPNGTPVGFAFVNNRNYIKVRIPQDVMSLPLHWDGSNYCQTRKLRFAGVRVDNPSTALIIEGLQGANACYSPDCSQTGILFSNCPDN